MDPRIIQTVYDITGQQVSTADLACNALVLFLKSIGQQDLIIDPTDLSLLIDLSAIYAKKNINPVIRELIKSEALNLSFNREKHFIKPTAEIDILIDFIAKQIQRAHPNLIVQRETGQCSLVMTNTILNRMVMRYDKIAKIRNLKDQFSGRVIIFGVKGIEQLEQVIPRKYRLKGFYIWRNPKVTRATLRWYGTHFTPFQVIDILQNKHFTGDDAGYLSTGTVVN